MVLMRNKPSGVNRFHICTSTCFSQAFTMFLGKRWNHGLKGPVEIYICLMVTSTYRIIKCVEFIRIKISIYLMLINICNNNYICRS